MVLNTFVLAGQIIAMQTGLGFASIVGVPLHIDVEMKQTANTDFFLDGGLAAPLPGRFELPTSPLPRVRSTN